MAAYTIEEHPLSVPYVLPEDAPNTLGMACVKYTVLIRRETENNGAAVAITQES